MVSENGHQNGDGKKRSSLNGAKAGMVHRQTAFLAAFAKCGNVTWAAKAAKINRHTHSAWLRDDATYPAKFAEAREEAVENLEECARKRATAGGSDLLLIFLLKANAPEKYREPSQRWSMEKTDSKTDTEEKTVYRLEFDRAG